MISSRCWREEYLLGNEAALGLSKGYLGITFLPPLLATLTAPDATQSQKDARAGVGCEGCARTFMGPSKLKMKSGGRKDKDCCLIGNGLKIVVSGEIVRPADVVRYRI